LTLAFPLPFILRTKSDVDTRKLAAAEVPPPGVEFDTVTESVPAVATSIAGMDPVSIVELTNVVDTGLPPKLISESASKPDPLTERVRAGLPTPALVGEMLFKTGSGLLTVKVDAVEVPPSGAGFVTVTEKEPAAAMLAAGIAAVSDVALTDVVGWAAPLKLTTAPETKFDPVTESVKVPLPAIALVGAIELRIGAGNVTVKVSEFVGF
jgi:hypothetical protein